MKSLLSLLILVLCINSTSADATFATPGLEINALGLNSLGLNSLSPEALKATQGDERSVEESMELFEIKAEESQYALDRGMPPSQVAVLKCTAKNVILVTACQGYLLPPFTNLPKWNRCYAEAAFLLAACIADAQMQQR